MSPKERKNVFVKFQIHDGSASQCTHDMCFMMRPATHKFGSMLSESRVVQRVKLESLAVQLIRLTRFERDILVK